MNSETHDIIIITDNIKNQYILEQTSVKVKTLIFKALEKKMFSDPNDVVKYMFIKAENIYPTTKNNINDTKEERLVEWNNVLNIVEDEIEMYGKILNKKKDK
jgi:flagella basal body P-ring formation protein FlgA